VDVCTDSALSAAAQVAQAAEDSASWIHSSGVIVGAEVPLIVYADDAALVLESRPDIEAAGEVTRAHSKE
jgi:hypothetical protein